MEDDLGRPDVGRDGHGRDVAGAKDRSFERLGGSAERRISQEDRRVHLPLEHDGADHRTARLPRSHRVYVEPDPLDRKRRVDRREELEGLEQPPVRPQKEVQILFLGVVRQECHPHDPRGSFSDLRHGSHDPECTGVE